MQTNNLLNILIWKKTFKAILLGLLWKNLWSLVESFQQYRWNCSLRVRRLILLTMFTVFSKFLDFQLKSLNYMWKISRRVVETGFYIPRGVFSGKIEVLVVFFYFQNQSELLSISPSKLSDRAVKTTFNASIRFWVKIWFWKKCCLLLFPGALVEFFCTLAEIYQQGCENCFLFLLKFVLRKQISRKNWRFFRVRHYWCRKVYPFVKTAFDLFIGTLCF